jgi:hypothetical protein
MLENFSVIQTLQEQNPYNSLASKLRQKYACINVSKLLYLESVMHSLYSLLEDLVL